MHDECQAIVNAALYKKKKEAKKAAIGKIELDIAAELKDIEVYFQDNGKKASTNLNLSMCWRKPLKERMAISKSDKFGNTRFLAQESSTNKMPVVKDSIH